MKYVGYHRVSTKQQNPDRGIYMIQDFCKERTILLYKNKVYVDQQTGKNFDRKWYTIIKDEILEPGDALIITEVDRLGRDMRATKDEIRWLQEHEIRLMIIKIPTTLLDYGDMENSLVKFSMELINNILLELFTYLAQSEMEMREQRQREGIEAKKRDGTWDDYGRPPVVDFKDFVNLYKNGGKCKEITQELHMSPATYYRYQVEYVKQYGKRQLPDNAESRRKEYDRFVVLFEQKKRPCEIIRELQISNNTYYRYKKEYLQSNGGDEPSPLIEKE